MSVLGLSILIASFSFFCYRCPPSSWLILQRPSLIFSSRKPLDDAPLIQLCEIPEEEIEEVHNGSKGVVEIAAKAENGKDGAAKQDLDRKAMPPPPPPFKKPPPTIATPSSVPENAPDSPITPRASSQPAFVLSSSSSLQEPEPSTPSFPALNSAQRASGGVRGPPRLDASSASLMPPPQRSTLPLPNRGPPSSSLSSSLAPPPTHSSIPTKPHRKVLLTPGHSPLDWARLSSSPSANLSGLPPGTPYLKVPPSLLKQMNGRKARDGSGRINDAWTVLGGKVYNISPYAPYHPGGEPELMKAAGRDGTRLFGEVHPWVNWEGMLEGCLVGIAVEEGDLKGGRMEEMD